MPPPASPPRSQRQSPSARSSVARLRARSSGRPLSSFHGRGEHEWHPDREDEHQPAGDEAEPGRAEAGDEAEGGHREVVEGVLERVALERLVDARHHHAASSPSARRAPRPGPSDEWSPSRREIARQRAEQQPEHRAEEELAGVVEVVVAVAYLGGIDDLREEGGQADDARSDPEAELRRGRERHTSAGQAARRLGRLRRSARESGAW